MQATLWPAPVNRTVINQRMAETIQNIFLGFINIIKSIFMVMKTVFDFYDEYGTIFLVVLIVVCLIDRYISKNETIVGQDQKEQKQRICPTWKIILVALVGYDCLFDLGLNDNITIFILLLFTFDVFKRSLKLFKYKKAVNL
jgi:hypothetical protein